MKKTFTKIMLLLFALVVGSSNVWADTYTLITSTTELSAGSDYIIVGLKTSNTSYYSLGTWTKGSSNKDYYAQTAITVSGDQCTDVLEAHIITIDGETNAWTLYDNSDSKYLACTADANGVQQANDASQNSAKWSISFLDGGDVILTNNSQTSRSLYYNTSATRFACYTNSQSGGRIFLYKKESGGGSLTPSNLAITGAPVALEFDLYNNSAAQNVSYTTSSTGAVSVSGGTGYVTTSLNTSTMIITVTPSAVTPSPQTITISQEADATYAAGSKTFTVSVANSAPTYTVTYDSNGGSGTMTDTNSPYLEGATVNIMANTFTAPEGKEWASWLVKDADDNTITPNDNNAFTMPASNVTITAQWQDSNNLTLTFDFEDEGAHRSSGNNNYSGDLTYSQHSVNISMHRFDGITGNFNSVGSYYARGRVAKSSTDSPILLIGPINISNWTISNISYQTKGNTDISQIFAISTDGGTTYVDQLSYVSSTSVQTKSKNVTIDGKTSLYLKWTGSVTSSNANSTRDFEVDNIVITYTTSGAQVVATPEILADNYSFYPSIQFSISCATGGATIRYTTDGSDPTTTSTVYSEPISLNATTTVKAKAFKGDMDPSEIAEVTFTKITPMTVAEAIAATPATGESDYVYVHGIVSEIVYPYSDSNHRISYNISDDGTTTSDQLEAYKGKGLNNSNFTSSNDIVVGDEVTIYGKLIYYNSTTYELADGNYLVERIHNTVQYDLTVNALSSNVNAIYVYNVENPSNPLIANGEAGTIAINDGTSIKVRPSIANGYILQTLTVDGADVTLQIDANGEYTFTMPSHNVAITATAAVPTYATYTRVTSTNQLIAGKTYIIVSTKTNGTDYVAMGSKHDNNYRLTVDVTHIDNDNSIIGNNNVREVVLGGSAGEWTLKDVTDDAYLKGYNGGNLYNSATVTDECYWTITIDEGYTKIKSNKYSDGNNDYYIMHNSAANPSRFACYKGTQRWTYLYEKTYDLYIDQYTANNNGWNLIASPVATTPNLVHNMLSNNYDLYRFNAAADLEWENYKNEAHQGGFTITPGQGYLYANSGNNDDGTTLKFSGLLYDGNGQITMANEGWNLIGNPYTVSTTVTNDFYIMNETGSGIIAAANHTVASMQGIFVEAETANEKVTFTIPSSKGRDVNSIESVVLNLKRNDKVIDRAIARLNSDRQMTKFQLFEGDTKLYFPMEDADYAIVSSNGHGTMPVNFKAKEMGRYTISVATEGTDLSYLHLIDRLTGEDVNLLLDNEYSFIASNNDSEERFILSFTEKGYDAHGNEIFVYQSGNDLIVNGEGELQIFDVMGRNIMNTTINGVQTVNVKSQGVYIFKLNEKTQKIIVR